MTPLRAWVRAKGRLFALATVMTALIVVLAGWFTEARDVMHTALLTLAVVALLPVIIVGGVLAFGIAISILGALAGDADGGAAALGADAALATLAPMEKRRQSLVERYDGFFGRRRHPVFWGIPAGLVLGSLVLWLVIGIAILPREGRTIERMVAAQSAIEDHYRAHGALPKPGVDGTLRVGDRVLIDGFGRPFAYRVRGAWKAASWSLQSPGYDGVASEDDLCLTGQTKLMKLADTIALGVSAITELRRGTAAAATKLSAIQALRCPRTFR